MTLPELLISETSDYFTLRKPPGITVDRQANDSPSLEQILLDAGGGKRGFVGIVHRLDKPVSGVVLVAKKKSILKQLNEQFANRQVHKTYLAVVQNNPPLRADTLHNYIKTNRAERRAEVIHNPKSGYKACELHYRQLKSQGGKHLLELHPKQGYYHQIRAQLAHCGCPILGDAHYGATEKWSPNTIALHALRLSFIDPTTGKRQYAEAQPEGSNWAMWL